MAEYPLRGLYNWDDDLKVYIDALPAAQVSTPGSALEVAVAAKVGNQIATTGTAAEVAVVGKIAATTAPRWKAATAYAAGDLVVNPYGQTVAVVTAHTASDAYDAAKFQAPAPVVPSMTVYETTSDPRKEVLFQDGATLYAHDQAAAGTIYKSVNSGKTWTAQGVTGFRVFNLHRINTTNTLIAIQETVRGTAGLNPKVVRSTDDGATWTQVTTLNFPGLGHQSMCSPASGVILLAEYGNVGNTVYRLMRSTDDGQTFTAVLSSTGTDSASDPGHIHSVTRDPYTGALVAFMDRSQPQVYTSADNGATWTLVGTSIQEYHPNFVAPMYFPGHIAWGVDNQSLGKIYRLSRADFYAGNWNKPETVAQLNRKVFYDTFPIRPDVWVISGATESVGGDTAGTGSYAQEVYVVSAGGSLVAGGVSHSTALSVNVDALAGQRASLPGYPAAAPDQKGRSWINLNTATGGGFAAVAYSVGDAPAMPRTLGGFITDPIMAPTTSLRARSSSGVAQPILTLDSTDRVRLNNPVSAANPEIRLYESATGLMGFIFGGAATILVQPKLVDFTGSVIQLNGTSGPALYSGTGPPEGVVTAPRGSVYLNKVGGAGSSAFIKNMGVGNIGWVAFGGGRTVVTVTTNYAMVRSDDVIITDKTTGVVTLLNAANSDVGIGRTITVKNVNASAASVAATAPSTIDGATSVSLAQWAKVTVVSDGTNWLTI
ncbi:hypothetical protein [Aeromicrobium sp.]|uniref:WD40/YVTN/BNR-like repeat-containing protein n=1 Tax=Aeromicrobium sp. TaxID=1871063 RepID=UPI0019AF9519|nr:hypothetical protein [Aeromicrobium sp.]MBC7630413.1 hypothetical protein [Aeromicrobium sp.]